MDSVQEGFVGEPTAPARSGGGSRQRSPEETRGIIRQSCLKAAAHLYAGRENATSEHVLGAAIVFEQWVLREDAPKHEPINAAQTDEAAEVPEEFRDIPF